MPGIMTWSGLSTLNPGDVVEFVNALSEPAGSVVEFRDGCVCVGGGSGFAFFAVSR